jgi:hypothetical protein
VRSRISSRSNSARSQKYQKPTFPTVMLCLEQPPALLIFSDRHRALLARERCLWSCRNSNTI